MTIFDVSAQEVVEKASVELEKVITAPSWSSFVKTGAGRERPPENLQWWYFRAASVLRKIYLHGPIGVSKLSIKYGNKKNRGHKPEKFYAGSGKVLRTILQQLEQASLVQQAQKGVHKGRIITPKGKKFLDCVAVGKPVPSFQKNES